MNDKQRGLYAKYRPIERADAPNEKHEDCEYFVLDLTHDPFAREAALMYAFRCRDEYPQLAEDLAAEVARLS